MYQYAQTTMITIVTTNIASVNYAQNSNDEDNTYYRTNGAKPKVTGV
jgi:hypothetical protein